MKFLQGTRRGGEGLRGGRSGQEDGMEPKSRRRIDDGSGGGGAEGDVEALLTSALELW
jgi:hypothetical protein